MGRSGGTWGAATVENENLFAGSQAVIEEQKARLLPKYFSRITSADRAGFGSHGRSKGDGRPMSAVPFPLGMAECL